MQRLRDFFALDDPWERPGGFGAPDVVTAGLAALVSGGALELYRGAGALETTSHPIGAQWAAVLSGAALLLGRRRLPLTVALLAAGHMFVVGVTMPAVLSQFTLQLLYFTAFCSGVAWARSRREAAVVFAGILLFMAVWLTWQFAVGAGMEQIRDDLGVDVGRHYGFLAPVTSWVLLNALINVLYFGGAVALGQTLWRTARQQARLAEQADLLQAQGAQLQRRAVIGERLRIARELHDVVAHHVSVIGVQAGAARRVLDRDGGRVDAARTALGAIEQSSREAVSQMRGLLGTLRADETDTSPGDGGDGDHTVTPGLQGLPELVAGLCRPGFEAGYQVVENPSGAVDSVPTPIAHSLYRTAQEALANVQRHSTATHAGVVLRVDRGNGSDFAEIEIIDDGRPRGGSSGSGLGQLGIRERAAGHRGEVEIGPRAVAGYRVRLRVPLTSQGAADPGRGTP